MNKFLRNALGVIIGLLIGMLLAEGALRVYYRREQGRKNLDHQQQRNRQRDVSHSLAKPVDTLRIAFLGDSMTYGQGVSFGDTFASRTGEILRRDYPSKKFEILNFGIPAYNVIDSLENLKKNVLAYDPDVIVFGFCVNDFNNPWAEADLIAKLNKEIRRYQFFRPLEKFSKLATFLDYAAYQLFSDVKELHIEWMNDSLNPARNPLYVDMRRALKELVQIISSRNGMVLILPILLDRNEDQMFFYTRARNLVVENCRQYGCPFLEAHESLKHRLSYRWWVSVSDHHLNRDAHLLVAKKVAAAVASRLGLAGT